MGNERRMYERIACGAKGAFFVQEDGELICDFAGTIENVSEGGACILIEQAEYEKANKVLEPGRNFSFQAYDDNGYSIHQEKGAFDGCMRIVRKIASENVLTLGCQVDGRNEKFQEYVTNKKTYNFIKSMSK